MLLGNLLIIWIYLEHISLDCLNNLIQIFLTRGSTPCHAAMMLWFMQIELPLSSEFMQFRYDFRRMTSVTFWSNFLRNNFFVWFLLAVSNDHQTTEVRSWNFMCSKDIVLTIWNMWNKWTIWIICWNTSCFNINKEESCKSDRYIFVVAKFSNCLRIEMNVSL